MGCERERHEAAASYLCGARTVGRVATDIGPADLPVEAPPRILLAVDMKTAAALGATIPQVVRLRADRMIE
ncbi:MAG: hypothetical protein JSS04_14065 [Proteobacteria bacterium]|nr:hypothetical protein [Pseudomonadota bacterium]